MENKSNEATPQRPAGDRTLNAPLVKMNLEHYITELKNESTWKESDRNSITLYKSEKLRVVLIGLHKHAELKTHTANGIITVQLLQGHIWFTAEGETAELQHGQMLALQKKIPHSVIAKEESFFLLTVAMD
jgi:quercetin dioxygenase-like cupin family protein